MNADKSISQCITCTQSCFRELWALYLLPERTAHAITRHLSPCAFKALAAIFRNAEYILCVKFNVMSRDELASYSRFRRELNLAIYGSVQPAGYDDANDNTLSERLAIQQKALWKLFNKVYKLIHLLLAHLLPFSSCSVNDALPQRNVCNVYLTRAWLLACVILPRDEFIVHAKNHVYAPMFKCFREIARNLIDGFFGPIAITTAHNSALQTLAGEESLKVQDAIELIKDAFPAIQFGADILTRYGASCLFPGQVPTRSSLPTGSYLSFT